MDAIRIFNLVKKYGTVVAVENLSLEVPKGSMFGFLGPNGSGKSTTIGCLTGLLDPTAGQIEILGERFTADSAGLKREPRRAKTSPDVVYDLLGPVLDASY